MFIYIYIIIISCIFNVYQRVSQNSCKYSVSVFVLSTRLSKPNLVHSLLTDLNGTQSSITNSTNTVITRINDGYSSSSNNEFAPLLHYLTISKSKVIIFSPRKGGGFANIFRSIRGILILAMLNNASFCINYDSFFYVMDDQLKVLSCNITIPREKWDHFFIINKFKSNPCDYIIENNIEIITSDDISVILRRCPKFLYDIRKYSSINQTNNLKNYLSRFLFRPKRYITDYGDTILSTMKGMKVGIQLRFGGNISDTKEQFVFLKPNHLQIVLKKINTILNQIKQEYSIFLSCDTVNGKKMLSNLQKPIVTVEKYPIGHSRKNNLLFLQRAITDLYILSKCDILFFTYWSSYGYLARDLSRSKAIYEIIT